MTDSSWKREEREVAREMGFERNPNTGFGHPDIDAGPFAVEVKKRKELPGWFKEAHEQARRNAGSSTPLVVFSEIRQGVKAKRYVSMEWEEWMEWFGPGGWARPVLEHG